MKLLLDNPLKIFEYKSDDMVDFSVKKALRSLIPSQIL